eukprot:CAMPEP_0113719688 /NCGR_PEP_ID=MMETSP0038_2-20120614/35989_1 /TAXON_ID=2898 /ORGANISM="Cryptomonas paramecium" /LENGTH=354 /DNA_ID=CAMNT_0000648159 /DNA_START=8 /DNA_END=1069 /DNA_ORIENTATION=+ /assembly_acc=CAM_ASM_000170
MSKIKKQKTEAGEEISRQAVKFGIPLDDSIPQKFKDSHHVYRAGSDIWDAKLNQTNTVMNNNKYYFIQLLESDKPDSGSYYVWTRWGRVGHVAGLNMAGPFNKELAMKEFESKFRSKTSGSWADRDSLGHIPNKYHYIKASYDFDKDDKKSSGEGSSGVAAKPSQTQPPPACKLEPGLQNLIKLVCNIDDMTKHMTEIGYDNKKLPLGKLAPATIEEGQRVLSQLSDVISGKAKGNVCSLSDHFYSVIPHDFGFQNMSAFVIRTEDDVKRKREMLESLVEVSFAIRLLADLSPASDPVTASYSRLGCHLERMEPDDTVAEMIRRCVATTAGCTGGHTHYTLAVEDVFSARRAGE